MSDDVQEGEVIPGSLYIRCEYSSTQLRNIYNHKSKFIKFCTGYTMILRRWGHSRYSCSKRNMAIPEPYWNPTENWECLFSSVLRTNYRLVFNSASWSKFPSLFFSLTLGSTFWELLPLKFSSVATSEVSFRGYVLRSLSSLVRPLPDPWGLRLF